MHAFFGGFFFSPFFSFSFLSQSISLLQEPQSSTESRNGDKRVEMKRAGADGCGTYRQVVCCNGAPGGDCSCSVLVAAGGRCGRESSLMALCGRGHLMS